MASSLWDGEMDEALLQYVRKNTYDFDKVCADLKPQFSAKTWMLSTDACRERFASLQHRLGRAMRKCSRETL
jgi:hypothetical protein